jgi:hypothetical protein
LRRPTWPLWLSRLKVFLATREDAWRYRGQMTLVVDGYNNDPRELVDIPEVRALLRGLEAEWPYWAFFFNQVDDSIKLLLSCVAGCRFLGRGAVEMDADLVAAALARGVRRHEHRLRAVRLPRGRAGD